MKPNRPSVQFNDATPQGADAKARAREAVARAKGQNVGRPRDLDLNQRFDQPVERAAAEPMPMREETQRGLEAMMETAKAQAAARASREEEEQVPSLEVPNSKLIEFGEKLLRRRDEHFAEDIATSVKEVAKALKLPEPPSKEESERLEWETSADLTPISIDAYIMNGFVHQVIPVIKDKLHVSFRTTLEGTEAFIETRLRDYRRDTGSQLTINELYRQQARLALAAQIVSFGTNKWPGLFDANGDVDPKVFDARLTLVRQIPAQIFPKVAQHLGWFNSRVDALLKDPEVLGNG